MEVKLKEEVESNNGEIVVRNEMGGLLDGSNQKNAYCISWKLIAILNSFYVVFANY